MIKSLNIATESFKELLWPTRCAICDKNHYSLCKDCIDKLSFVDQFSACNKCGEPYGYNQCCGCVDVKTLQEKKYYYKKCRSSLILDKYSGRIISLYKDAGDIQLKNIMTYFMYKTIPKSWLQNALLTYIPSSEESINKRGYDHCKILCKTLSIKSSKKMIDVFKKPNTKDQRNLDRNQRYENFQNSKFKLINKNCLNTLRKYKKIIIIDDVYTTGLTLNSACKCLYNYEIKNTYCLTFARTYNMEN